jgi:hypothetical protein
MRTRAFQIAAALGAATLLAAASASLRAADNDAAPPNGNASPPQSSTDDAAKSNGDDANKKEEPLSKKLEENEGVLKPKSNVDPEIHKAPPEATKDKMPVIIPPGEPGGDQSIQPK